MLRAVDGSAALWRRGDPAHAAETEFGRAYPKGSHQNQWWITGDDSRMYATCICGQFFWLDIARDLVIVKLSSLPAALDYAIVRDHPVAFQSIAAAIR